MRLDRSAGAGEADDAGAPDAPVRIRSAADVSDPWPGRGEKAAGGDARPARAPAAFDAAPQTERSLASRAAVDAAYRQYAIDQGCARVEKLERETVTPAMRRIEAEDPERRLAGLEHRLKERYRIEEKVTEAIEERGRSAEEAIGMVKDAIRYTFCYPEDRYTDGVYADCERLENAGFGPYDRRNSWGHDEYKGINSRWRIPESGQLFEVQFHTEASLAAKEETHGAYKRIRTLPEDDAEVARLHAYQREVTSKVAIPHGAHDVSDYHL